MARTRQTRRIQGAVAAAVIALLIALSGLATTPASAAPLPERTPQQLLVDLQTAGATPLEGTVTHRADLGLPALPVSPHSVGGASLGSLLTGTHTLRVWTDGAERSRVAVLADQAEIDLIRNGRDVWVWQSSDQTARHLTLPEDHGQADAPRAVPSDAPRTPQEWADRVLARADETTVVTSGSQVTVAGRPAYALVLTPKAAESRVEQVTIAIDGEKYVPLRIQVFSTELDTPAIEVGFTDVTFKTPDADVFAFTPAEGVTVTETTMPTHQGVTPTPGDRPGPTGDPGAAKPTITGSGWGTIASGRFDPAQLAAPTGAPQSDDPQSGARESGAPQSDASEPDASRGTDPASLLNLLPSASGAWGSGHVLDGTLFSVVVTDDGRYAVGAVAPEALFAALPAR